MVRLIRLIISCAFPFFCLSGYGPAAAEEVAAPGFVLPAFEGAYPGGSIIFEGEEAKRLAREILPVAAAKVERVRVSETLLVPGAIYIGLSIDIVLEARPIIFSLCEEPHVDVSLRYDGRGVPSRGTRLTLRGGVVPGHSFEMIHLSGRYRALPEKIVSHDAALVACRTLAVDAAGWTPARNALDYDDRRKRQLALIDAIGTLPIRKIRCVGTGGKACAYAREKLIGVVRDAPLASSETIVTPGEGVVYRYSLPDGAAGMDYDAMLRFDLKNQPEEVDIRFSPPRPIP